MANSSCSSSGLWQPKMVLSVNSCTWLQKLIYAFITENITFEINTGKKVGKICRLPIKSPVFKTAKDSENEGILTCLGPTRKVVIRKICLHGKASATSRILLLEFLEVVKCEEKRKCVFTGVQEKSLRN